MTLQPGDAVRHVKTGEHGRVVSTDEARYNRVFDQHAYLPKPILVCWNRSGEELWTSAERVRFVGRER